MNLIDAFKADFYVLQGKDKGHKLLDGRVELTNDVLRGKHHTERDVAVYNCRGGKDGDEDIFKFIDEYTTCFLRLLQSKALGLHMEEVALRLLPFLATTALALLQFYLLHGSDELVGFVLVNGLLLKELVVQNFSVSKKMGEPKTVGKAANYEYGKDGKVVECQHSTKYHKTDAGEHHAEGLIGEERLYTPMVVHTLQQVAHELGVEEGHRQPQQLDEEVAH